MAIIIAVIAAVIVIALLITFNVRSTSAGQDVKEEKREAIGTTAEQPEKHDPAEERSAEHAPVVVKSESPREKKNTMGDDVYRQALQKFKTSETDEEPNDPDSGGKMQDSSYRDALLSLKNKKK
ncbi:hypothetical protein ACLNGX_04875 [Bacillus velezensis]|uniref:hypothetical protein n=1 Tax=Bacillus velezensis TaxID=492670 RepID=UPI0039A11858